MPWLWALTGNSLLDGHECVVGQISQLHLTASERGRPSLSLQLWQVSHPHQPSLTCPPSPFPPRLIGKAQRGGGQRQGAAGWTTIFAFCLCLTFLSSSCMNIGVGFFLFFWKKSFLWAWKSISLCVHACVYASASPGKLSNFHLNACHFAFVVTGPCCFSVFVVWVLPPVVVWLKWEWGLKNPEDLCPGRSVAA